MDNLLGGDLYGVDARPSWVRRFRLWVARKEWWFIAALAGVSFGVAVYGFWHTGPGVSGGTAMRSSDAVYRALQLFAMEWGVNDAVQVHWTLHVARFLAPLSAGWAAFHGLMAVFRDEWDAFRAKRSRNHVIVCGLGDMGARFALNFRKAQKKVVAIERDSSNPNIRRCREQGVHVLLGDGALGDALRDAGIARAARLVAVCDDEVNVEIAMIARRSAAQRKAKGALPCLVHIYDVHLCAELSRREFSNAGEAGVHVNFFNVLNYGTRSLLKDHPILAGELIHLAVVGTGDFAENFILHAVREWWSDAARRKETLHITVVDRDATAWVDEVCRRYPYAREGTEVTGQDIAVPSPEFDACAFLAAEGTQPPVSAAIVCFENESQGLYSALVVQERLRAIHSNAVVYLRTRSNDGLAATTYRGIHVFGLLDEVCRAEFAEAPGLEMLLAQAIHEDYYRTGLAKGRMPRHESGMFPWAELPESLRDSNRAQARDIPRKVKLAGYRIESMKDFATAGRIAFEPKEIEMLAEAEHKRWCAEKESKGYIYGPVRNDHSTPPTHPCLVEYAALSEEMKDRDRDPVRKIPEWLAMAGYCLARVNGEGR